MAMDNIYYEFERVHAQTTSHLGRWKEVYWVSIFGDQYDFNDIFERILVMII